LGPELLQIAESDPDLPVSERRSCARQADAWQRLQPPMVVRIASLKDFISVSFWSALSS
jgi:hypothetical protein